MTDVIDQLRELNPVLADQLDVPLELAPRALVPLAAKSHSRRPRVLIAAGLGAAGALGVLVLIGGSGGSGDLAARAYAATAGPGVLHWRTEIANYVDGRRTRAQRSEGWSANGVVHVLDYDLPGGRPRLISDLTIANGRKRAWLSVSNDYISGPAPTKENLGPVPIGDPFAAFRGAYREDRLTKAGEHRYRLTFPARSPRYRPANFTYLLDPRTAMPRRLVVDAIVPAAPGRARHHFVSVLTFAVYERLPSTLATRAKLALLPHPGAGPGNIPASRYFAVLRRGQAPTGADARALRDFAAQASRYDIDAAGIRALRPGVWLMPGHGYVCIAVANPKQNGLAGSCSTLARTLHHGLSVGSGGGPMTLVVPDRARSIRARLPHHRWRRFAVHHNTVTLPSLGYHWKLTAAAPKQRAPG